MYSVTSSLLGANEDEWCMGMGNIVWGVIVSALASLVGRWFWLRFNERMADKHGPEVLDKTRHLYASPPLRSLPEALRSYRSEDVASPRTTTESAHHDE